MEMIVKIGRFAARFVTLAIVVCALPSTVEAKFVLGPNDRINISVLSRSPEGLAIPDPAVSGDYIIDPDGNITLHYIGEMHIAGLSPGEAIDLLKERFSEYYINPDVNVRVVQIASRRVVVLGEVYRVGVYDIPTDETALGVLAMAGGPRGSALLWNVKVIRGGLDDPQVLTCNLDKALKKGDYAENIQLMPGDIVYVPRTLLARANDVISKITPTMGLIIRSQDVGDTFK
ncbi:MAG: polysaccharide export protein [Candidatus Coatesbacteria bacterium]|nr:MAG: polysaccharide export protein [Candidatus Coatesbacteria bacterium]